MQYIFTFRNITNKLTCFRVLIKRLSCHNLKEISCIKNFQSYKYDKFLLGEDKDTLLNKIPSVLSLKNLKIKQELRKVNT